MVKWSCDRCQTVHNTNPGKCKKCEYTVFTQHRAKRQRARPVGQARSGSGHSMAPSGDGLLGQAVRRLWPLWLVLGVLVVAQVKYGVQVF